VDNALRSGWLTMGPRTVEFENRFRETVQAKFAVAVNSCTAAMHLALKVIGLQAGDEVIIPDMTFTATGEVVRYFNAVPVLIDVDRQTQNILPEEIERNITPKTRAIIPVHFGGQPVNLDEILVIAKKYNLKIIEDAAHCFPSFYKGKPIGSFGDITAFSFYATKTLAVGEGGMATTQVKEYAEKMRVLRLHGISKDAWKRYSREGNWYYEVVDAGFKYNTTDIQASLGLTQLNISDRTWKLRAKIAERYNHAFQNIDQLILPKILTDRETSWHLYVIKLRLESLKIDRNVFIRKLKDKGIGVSVHFIPLHLHPYYRSFLKDKGSLLKNSRWLYKRIISLPIFPGMTNREVDYVIENVLDIARSYGK
jgi:dTDP-4-amino-4,6-dideoxygalactose transaminase